MEEDDQTETVIDHKEQTTLDQGVLLEEERGLTTPGAAVRSPGARRNRRGGRGSRQRRLVDYHIFLSEKHNLPPSNLMLELAAKSLKTVGRKQQVPSALKVVSRKEVQTDAKSERVGGKWRRRHHEAELTASPCIKIKGRSRRWQKQEVEQTASPCLKGIKEKEVKQLETDAKSPKSLGQRLEEEEAEHTASPHFSAPPPSTETKLACRSTNPYMQQWSRWGEVEGEQGLGGPEVTWVDQWLGQGWAGPLSSVYICYSCQGMMGWLGRA